MERVWQAAQFGLAIASVLVGLRVLYLLFVYPYFVSPLRNLPGPKDHHLVLGHHLNQFRSGDPEQPYVAWMQRWPTAPLIRYFEFGHADAVLINSAEAYRDVMQTQCYSFVRSSPFRRLIGDIIGSGLVFAEGHVHRAQRKALGGLFRVSRIRPYLPAINAKALETARLVGAACDDGRDVDVKDLFARVALDVVGLFALGRDLESLAAKGETEFMRCYRRLFDLGTSGMVLAAVNLVVPVRWLPLAANRDFLDASQCLRSVLANMVDERISADKSQETLEPQDMLTYMVTRCNAPETEHWTRDDVVEQALNFVATGHETTAGALTFALHKIGHHPDVVHRIRDEARAAEGTGVDWDRPTLADIDKLVYLDHVLKECLRVLPPVAGIPRVALHDLVVAGQPIAKGTTLLPVPAVLHHNPAIWGADALEFRPERWDDMADNAPAADVTAWVGFGHGPRACIGRALATLTFKLVLLQLCLRYEFDPVHRGKVPVVNPSGQLRPLGDVWMHVKRADLEPC